MATAFDRGVSAFYWNSGPAHDAFREGLRELAQSSSRESLFVIANGGSPSRGAGDHRQAERVLEDFALAKRELGVGYIDLFVLQYIQPYEESETVLATLDALCANRPQTACPWLARALVIALPAGAERPCLRRQELKARGEIRYVAMSTHDFADAVPLIDSGKIDVAMLRYNMAHR